jgi:hypothetical protein
MKTAFLIIPVIALMLAFVTTSIASRAYADDPSYTQGYNIAKFDFLHNRAYDDSCSPNNGDAFCAGYKVGYYAGWNAANLLYGNQSPHQ